MRGDYSLQKRITACVLDLSRDGIAVPESVILKCLIILGDA